MNFFYEFTNNKVLLCCFVSWLIAQILKITFVFIKTKKIDISRLVGAGGMPSSHTSLVMALSTSIGLIEGFHSVIYALALALSLIVMYDAAGVRRAAGKQAQVLNSIIETLAHNERVSNEKLKELLGHTPKEVLAGAILGIIVANIMIY